ncbi:MAG: phosphatase PAP2 family protein [Hyphomicrobiales bacterium]|nr:phosphatase PAP2 family protein [Hyphomicrobiales bacterium]
MSLNQAIFVHVSAGAHPAPVALAVAVAIANWALYIAPLTLIVLWLRGTRDDRCAAVSATLAAFAALGAAAVISSHIMHPRPFMDGLSPNWLDHAPDSSMPSDHATLLFALGFALWLNRPPKFPKVHLLLLTVACAVSFARVWLGAHYPGDIGIGTGLGLAAALLAQTAPFRAGVGKLTDFGIWLYGWTQRMLSR